MSKKIFSNSLWMMAEKVISIFGLIFVTSFVAKYIGPESFGKLAFVGSIFAIVQTIAMMGTENIIFQKIAKNKKIGETMMIASKKIRDYIYIFCTILILISLYLYTDQLTLIFGVATGIAIYFAVNDVYSIYFNAILKSKINAYCNIFALIISLFSRYLIAFLNMPVELLIIPIILVTIIPFYIRKYIYRKSFVTIESFPKEKILRYRKYTFEIGKKLILYSLSVAILTRTSQLFLGIHSKFDLGIYTVAMTLGNGFYFILFSIISSYFTVIYKENNIEKSHFMVARLYIVIIFISFIIIAFLHIFGPLIVIKLYGEEYRGVNKILWVAGLWTLLAGLSTIAEKYIMKFHAYDYLKKKMIVLVIFNIFFTFYMVSFFGLNGGIWAILITEFLSFTLLNYFVKKGIIWETQKRILWLNTYKKN